MAKPLTHHIDLKQIADLGHTGIRRAAIFMGLGLNAANRPDFKEYQLTEIPRYAKTIGYKIIGPVDDARIEQFKATFADWIVACGLREILEHYGLLLARLHHEAMIVLQTRDLLKYLGDPATLQRNHFENPGLAAKFQDLRARFKIETKFEEQITQLYKLRNIIDHNFQTVTDKPLNAENKFVVSWEAFDVFGVGEGSGAITPYAELIDKVLPEPTKIVGKRVRREKVYERGDRVTLDGKELEEICFFFSFCCIPSILKSFVEFGKRHGVNPASGDDEL
ncbi:MAG: hypothetical protein QM780_15730 [Hyphomicrobium sp.]|uniref:hypothetical protein n=1 Tax=Hyphomicrobium sp. TaxID=82 RepID=UPI0039E5FBA4